MPSPRKPKTHRRECSGRIAMTRTSAGLGGELKTAARQGGCQKPMTPRYQDPDSGSDRRRPGRRRRSPRSTRVAGEVAQVDEQIVPVGYRRVRVLLEAFADDALQIDWCVASWRVPPAPRRNRRTVISATSRGQTGAGHRPSRGAYSQRRRRLSRASSVAAAMLLGRHVGVVPAAVPAAVRATAWSSRSRSFTACLARPKSSTLTRPRSARQHDVLRLDIAVHDAARMGLRERIGDLFADADRLRQRRKRTPRAAGRRASRPRCTASR